MSACADRGARKEVAPVNKGRNLFQQRWRAVLVGAIIGTVYFALRMLGPTIAGSGIPVWPAAGVASAALMLFGPAYWPVVLVAGFPGGPKAGFARPGGPNPAHGEPVAPKATVRIQSF